VKTAARGASVRRSAMDRERKRDRIEGHRSAQVRHTQRSCAWALASAIGSICRASLQS
jgi:hypothetical protein